jgi:hypothetical protein
MRVSWDGRIARRPRAAEKLRFPPLARVGLNRYRLSRSLIGVASSPRRLKFFVGVCAVNISQVEMRRVLASNERLENRE